MDKKYCQVCNGCGTKEVAHGTVDCPECNGTGKNIEKIDSDEKIVKIEYIVLAYYDLPANIGKADFWIYDDLYKAKIRKETELSNEDTLFVRIYLAEEHK